MASVRRAARMTHISKTFTTVAALALCCNCVWSQASTITALVHVNVVDVRSGHIEHDSCVVIRDKRIVTVGRSCGPLPPSRRLVEGKGGFLIPGLWDMHVHSDGKELALTSMLRAGLTGVRDMGGNLEDLEKARNEVRSGKWRGPMLLFAGPLLEGPPAEPEDDIWIIHDAQEARSAVGRLADAHVDFIKVHDNLSREAYFEIAAASKEHRLSFAGHVSKTISPVEASNAGQASIEHFEFLPKPCLPLLGDQEVPAGCERAAIDSMLQIFARNGTYLDLTLQSFQYWVPAQWPTTFAAARGLVQQIRKSRLRILAGTDWGTYLERKGARPGWCLHDELEILVRAGFTPLEALQAATLNPAVFLGLKEELGTVEPGKVANLVLLRANPLANIKNTRTIAAVFLGGQVVSFHD
jgi:imidazolonepropionase-like amidohydrolase